MLLEAYRKHAIAFTQCIALFDIFKIVDIDERDKEQGRPLKTPEEDELQELMDEDMVERR